MLLNLIIYIFMLEPLPIKVHYLFFVSKISMGVYIVWTLVQTEIDDSTLRSMTRSSICASLAMVNSSPTVTSQA
jgi:hypothetical protein